MFTKINTYKLLKKIKSPIMIKLNNHNIEYYNK